MVWSYPHYGQLYLVLAVGLAAVLILEFRFGATKNARSKVLLALRSAAVSVLVLILLNPTREEHEKHPGPRPSALFLLDRSRSMGLESPTSRSQAAEQIIRRAEGLVPADRRPEIQNYVVRARSVRQRLSRRMTNPRSPTKHGWGGQTRQLPSRFGDTVPFGVFVFSDGRSTGPDVLDATARAYRELGLPVHVIPLGDERISRGCRRPGH